MKKRTSKPAEPVGADHTTKKPAELVGADYVAVVRLSSKDNRSLALPGQGCDDVPTASLGWLLRSGKIRKADVN